MAVSHKAGAHPPKLLQKPCKSVMTDFKKANNLTDVDFPFRDYNAILDKFIDDLAVYTPRNNPDNYKGKCSPHANAFNSH